LLATELQPTKCTFQRCNRLRWYRKAFLS